MVDGKSSLAMILWIFLIFRNLSLDDSYKLDSYGKVSEFSTKGQILADIGYVMFLCASVDASEFNWHFHIFSDILH